MLKYNTEYLIMHEDSVDWDEISKDKEQYLSLVETKLFRKRIDWKVYLPLHQSTITHDILECASKYFTPEVYEVLAGFNILDDEFILNHKDKFNYKLLIENSNCSPDVLLETSSYWKDIPGIHESFERAKHIDINSDKYDQVKLLLDCI